MTLSKTVAILLFAVMPLAAQEAPEKIGLTVLHDIKSQAFQHNFEIDDQVAERHATQIPILICGTSTLRQGD